jgi:hypothetical protein
MSLKYDLSSNVILARNVIPIIWEKSYRTKCLIQYFVSNFEFPLCISEIIAWYDYMFECKLDCILNDYSEKITETRMIITCMIHENKMISRMTNLSDSGLLWNLKEYPTSMTVSLERALREKVSLERALREKVPIPMKGIMCITDKIADISNICMVCVSNERKNYNMTVWEHTKNSSLDDINNWKIKSILSGHTGMINSIDNLHNNKIISCSKDKTIRIWDLQTGNCDAILDEHTEQVTSPRTQIPGFP